MPRRKAHTVCWGRSEGAIPVASPKNPRIETEAPGPGEEEAAFAPVPFRFWALVSTVYLFLLLSPRRAP